MEEDVIPTVSEPGPSTTDLELMRLQQNLEDANRKLEEEREKYAIRVRLMQVPICQRCGHVRLRLRVSAGPVGPIMPVAVQDRVTCAKVNAESARNVVTDLWRQAQDRITELEVALKVI